MFGIVPTYNLDNLYKCTVCLIVTFCGCFRLLHRVEQRMDPRVQARRGVHQRSHPRDRLGAAAGEWHCCVSWSLAQSWSRYTARSLPQYLRRSSALSDNTRYLLTVSISPNVQGCCWRTDYFTNYKSPKRSFSKFIICYGNKFCKLLLENRKLLTSSILVTWKISTNCKSCPRK